MFHFVYADEDGNGYINEDYFGLVALPVCFSFFRPADHNNEPKPDSQHDWLFCCTV